MVRKVVSSLKRGCYDLLRICLSICSFSFIYGVLMGFYFWWCAAGRIMFTDLNSLRNVLTFDVEELTTCQLMLLFLTLNTHSAEAYSELCQTCKLELFEKISNGFQPYWFFSLCLNFLLQWSRCYSSYFLDNRI